jgi:hypothetical protein
MHIAGKYDETVFKAIDYVLDQMSQQGIRVIVAFIDYWKKTDGVQQVRSPGLHAAAVSSICTRATCLCCRSQYQLGWTTTQPSL